MDPQVALEVILDGVYGSDEMNEAFDALHQWLQRGGFTPTVPPRNHPAGNPRRRWSNTQGTLALFVPTPAELLLGKRAHFKQYQPTLRHWVLESEV